MDTAIVISHHVLGKVKWLGNKTKRSTREDKAVRIVGRGGETSSGLGPGRSRDGSPMFLLRSSQVSGSGSCSGLNV